MYKMFEVASINFQLAILKNLGEKGEFETLECLSPDGVGVVKSRFFFHINQNVL